MKHLHFSLAYPLSYKPGKKNEAFLVQQQCTSLILLYYCYFFIKKYIHQYFTPQETNKIFFKSVIIYTYIKIEIGEINSVQIDRCSRQTSRNIKWRGKASFFFFGYWNQRKWLKWVTRKQRRKVKGNRKRKVMKWKHVM